MITAVFYDRKNKREITTNELMLTRLVQSVAVGDDDDDYVPTGRRKHGPWGGSFTEEGFYEAKKRGYFKQCGEDDTNVTWESLKHEMTPTVLYLKEQQIADLCYKSDKCPDYINGDVYTTTNDLVFLRFE